MKSRICLALTLSAVLMGTAGLRAQEKKEVSFGALEALTAEGAQAKAQAWLKEAGKTDAATQAKFQAIWKDETRSILDRLADTFGLGSPDAHKLLTEVRDPSLPAPTDLPAILKDPKQSAFFRSNLALAYARNLSNKKVYDEALDVLKVVRPEQVADPSSYLFFRAVTEHALLLKADANKTINRLLRDAADAPERYKTVGMLMMLDMHTWRDKDLGDIARKMNKIKDRLDLARGGEKTQKYQKEVIARLDELIKELENKGGGGGGGGGGDPNGGGCPNGGPPGGSGPPQGDNPSSPATESGIAGGPGTGKVDPAKMRKLVEQWGRLPPREQAKALQELTQGLSPRHREAIENYFRNLATARK